MKTTSLRLSKGYSHPACGRRLETLSLRPANRLASVDPRWERWILYISDWSDLRAAIQCCQGILLESAHYQNESGFQPTVVMWAPVLGVAPGWYMPGPRPSADCTGITDHPSEKRRRREPYQPGATPQEPVQPQHEQGLKARSILSNVSGRQPVKRASKRPLQVCHKM